MAIDTQNNSNIPLDSSSGEVPGVHTLLMYYADKSKLHNSLNQDVVLTTSDKLKLALTKYKDGLIAKTAWITPLSLFVTLVAAIIATDFKKIIISAELWQALFYLMTLASFVWLIASLIRKFRTKENAEDRFIKEILNQLND
ncbi:hypothetical protein BC351_14890 [Paenibacillus ferrarius]|uniref:Uncharacterized protein n=1 Tax=Paenibacillus ferrarius TaxID=1469647 RepID=A0A1V4HRK6_9BACL|nr:hypothetical protein [Paenibacillus ferrarius]OPH61226.1 hypothetical protein BC351_14890 [Paenibacillus ferrarius]